MSQILILVYRFQKYQYADVEVIEAAGKGFGLRTRRDLEAYHIFHDDDDDDILGVNLLWSTWGKFLIKINLRTVLESILNMVKNITIS